MSTTQPHPSLILLETIDTSLQELQSIDREHFNLLAVAIVRCVATGSGLTEGIRKVCLGLEAGDFETAKAHAHAIRDWLERLEMMGAAPGSNYLI